MLKKLTHYNFLNSFFYSIIPILRLPSIYFFVGADFFKSYVLVNSLTLFLPEVLFISYDSQKNVDRSFIIFVINIALSVALFFLFVGAVSQNILVSLISYSVFDQLSIIDSINREAKKSMIYHFIRLLSVLFIILELFSALFITTLISFIWLIKDESTFNQTKIFQGLINNIKLVGITRIRDFLLNNFLVAALDNNIFFIFKLLQSGFANLAGFHYTYLRNNIFKKNKIKKYMHLIISVTILSGIISLILSFIPLLESNILFSYIILFIVPMIFFLENLITQLNLLYIRNSIYRMTISNSFVLLGYAIINLIFYNISFQNHFTFLYYVSVICIIYISIFLLLNNRKYRTNLS